MANSIKEDLLSRLGHIKGSGHYVTHGEQAYIHPGLSIAGIGEIGLPLSATQTADIIVRAHKAPFGKGSQTITDTSVRSAWEIDAAQISFQNPGWASFMSDVVNTVQKALDLKGEKVNAHLYKLLLYETGDFFLPHKDSEKEKGMFGTLVISLPSVHTGGELVVRFDGREEIIDFSQSAAQYKIPYAAFFADCDHEIKPVTSGYRLALVYNLVQSGKGKALKSVRLSDHTDGLAKLLTDLKNTEQLFPLAILLDHQYTPANFSGSALKLHDLPRAESLMQAATQAGYFARLGLVTHYLCGDLQYDSPRRRSYYDAHIYDDDYLTKHGYMGDEIYETQTEVKHWASDELPDLGNKSLKDEQIWGKEDLGEGEPLEKVAEGYTGNAGMTMDYWYHYGAVVLWPRSQHTEVLLNTRPETWLHWLDYYADQCEMSATDTASTVRTFIEALCLIEKPEQANYTPFAKALIFLNDKESAQHSIAFLGRVFEYIEVAQWVALLSHFSPALVGAAFQIAADRKEKRVMRQLTAVLMQLESASEPTLRDFLAEQKKQLPAYLASLHLYDMKSADAGESFSRTGLDYSTEECRKDIIENLLTLSRSLEENAAWLTDLLKELIPHVPRSYIYKVLAPLLSRYKGEWGVLAEALLLACKEELTERVDNKPQPPADWRRSYPQKGDIYPDVWKILGPFMESPTQRVYDYRSAQSSRSHMERAIRYSEVDLTWSTIRQGSPHILRLTKTQASFEKSLSNWHEDVKLLKTLSGLSAH